MRIKTKISMCLCACLVLLCAVVLSSCGADCKHSNINRENPVQHEEYHIVKCVDCDEEIKEAHNFLTKVTTDATCVADGVGTRTCVVCDYSEEIIIPAKGHVFEDGACKECETENIVLVNDTEYKTLAEAVSAITTSEPVTIKLLGDVAGDGVIVNKADVGQDITFDFNGFTYTLNGTTVGSTGTETNGFQLLKGSKVTFKNGTLVNPETKGAKIMLQNYSDLTLDNFTVDVSKSEAGYGTYAVSNNFGSLTVKNNSNIIAKEGGVAFDLWYGMNKDGLYDKGITVNIEEDAGLIDGIIEYGAATRGRAIEGWMNLTRLNVNGGVFTNFVISAGDGVTDTKTANIVVNQGIFVDDAVLNYIADDTYTIKKTLEDQTVYVVVDSLTKAVKVEEAIETIFKK